MNTLRNKVTLIGRLGAKPEIMKFETGRKLARFTLATNERYPDGKGGWKDDTQWHNVNAWGKTAENIEKILEKGSEVIVEGKLVHQTFNTKSGEKRYATVVEINDFALIMSKKEQKENV
jgi:single-strand DNA-binding protein